MNRFICPWFVCWFGCFFSSFFFTFLICKNKCKIYLSSLAVQYIGMDIGYQIYEMQRLETFTLDEWRTISIHNSHRYVWKESKTIIHEIRLSSMNCLHAHTHAFFFFFVSKPNPHIHLLRTERWPVSFILFYYLLFLNFSFHFSLHIILNFEREKVKSNS